jgi:hypothetical protein
MSGQFDPFSLVAVFVIVVALVEERLDFSERLLADGRQADPLPGRLQQ